MQRAENRASRRNGVAPVAFPKRRSTRLLAAAAARLAYLSGVGYLALAYTVSRFLTRPRRRRIERTPADIGLAYQSLSIVSGDGLELAAWLLEPDQPRGTVALFHGMRRNREQMLTRIDFLHAAGYRCIVVDHRGHGESGGKRISFGWYEARDVQATARWIAERFGGQPRFALGISMGAAAICFAGPNCGWSGAILEGAYADLAQTCKRRIQSHYPRWFAELYPAVIWFTHKRLRIRMGQVRPAEAIARLEGASILVVAGELDQLAPLPDARAIARGAKPAADVAVIEGAGHNDMCEIGGERYRERILAFLKSK
jgi:uncharacterized protein